MPLFEAAGNLHLHTPYSDGELYHAEVADAAIRAGLDFLLFTDHNVLVTGVEGWHERDGKRVLVMTGEEIHDQTRQPQKNHLLAYGADRELAALAADPQKLIDGVNEAGGLAFLAHPHDPPASALHGEAASDLSWVSWEVQNYHGLELWHYMTSFKSLLRSRRAILRYAFHPEEGISGPHPDTLRKWDELLAAGQKVAVVGSADAHGHTYRMWGITRVIFPYEYLFRCINTHLLSERPFTGDAAADTERVLEALRRGHCFVGYDLPAPTRGFRFSANTDRGSGIMGDTLALRGGGVTLQIAVPRRATLRLLRDGEQVGRWENREYAHFTANRPGAYRAEAYIQFNGQLRGWIYSNPIHVQG
ncbi:MAG: CehA/McbA family metallohydrolase [Chloroflexi bacterium]|nr:CehA/McbA family metallohydrolase [Chloroflexota bacterium]